MAVQNLSRRERALALAAILAIAAAALYNFAIEPAFTGWRKLNEEINSETAYLIKNKRLLGKYNELEEEYAQFPSRKETAETEEKEVAATLASIEAISVKSACRIQNVRPRASKAIGNYKEISFEVIADGRVGQFARFLYEIETSGEMLQVKRYTISAKAGSQGELKGVFFISKVTVR